MMTIDPTNWWSFLLIFVRISSFMVTAPVFSGRQLPAIYKLGLSFALSILCIGTIDEPIDLGAWMLFQLILKEFLVGLVLGLATNVLFYSIQLAGSLIDLQIGFSMANIFDPTFGTNTQLTGHFKNILAILFLLATNGHHLLIYGVLASFDWVSLQATVPAWFDGRVSSFLLEALGQMFIIGFMMAFPIIGTLFVVDVAIGFIARTVPQMNIFAVLPPVKILVHFIIYIFILPSFFYLLKLLFEQMFETMYTMLKIMGA